MLVTVGLSGCGNKQTETGVAEKRDKASPDSHSTRWYSQEQVMQGRDLYQTYCAECHQPDASGTTNWRSLNAEGKLPPPPLNGTAHTWHHPLSVLRRTVRLGGVPLGGSMPGFADKLSDEQIDAILAWVQTRWSDEIYHIWHERNQQAESRLKLNRS